MIETIQSHAMVILGIDWGERRIGVAVSWTGHIAAPHSVIANDGIETAIERLRVVSEETEAEHIVLGVPAGSRHDAQQIRARFDSIAESLRQKTCRSVELWDESYTTAEALAQRNEAGGSRRRREKKPIDSLAAAVILQSWIDARQSGESIQR